MEISDDNLKRAIKLCMTEEQKNGLEYDVEAYNKCLAEKRRRFSLQIPNNGGCKFNTKPKTIKRTKITKKTKKRKRTKITKRTKMAKRRNS
jgi:hypothetical protein